MIDFKKKAEELCFKKANGYMLPETMEKALKETWNEAIEAVAKESNRFGKAGQAIFSFNIRKLKIKP